MKPPKIIIPIYVVDIKACVYKLYYGEYYIIIMSNSIYRSIWSINDDLARYYSYNGQERSKDGLYGKFCKHVLANPKQKFRFEMLFVSDSPYEILKACKLALDSAKEDTYCLNTSYEPFVSKRIQTNPKYLTKAATEHKYWISRGHYLNYKKWEASHSS